MPQELRFVSKQDKSGRQVCIAFAQFTSTYFATRCLKLVQVRQCPTDCSCVP